MRTKENSAIVQEGMTGVRDWCNSIDMKSSRAMPCFYGPNTDPAAVSEFFSRKIAKTTDNLEIQLDSRK